VLCFKKVVSILHSKTRLLGYNTIASYINVQLIRKYMARSTGRKRFWFQQTKDENKQPITEQQNTTQNNANY